MAEDRPRPGEELVQGSLSDDPGFLKEIVERVLHQLLETQITKHVGTAPYERTDERRGHRNGYKPRTLRTRVGILNLFVP